MLVQLVNKKVFIDDLLSYSKVVSRGKLTKSVYDLVLESYNVFKNDVVEDVYYIECEHKEIDNFLKKFLKTFYWDKHLCVCSFIGKSVPVDSISVLKQCCIDSDYYRCFPLYITDNIIRMYVSYYKEKERIDLDVDYIVNLILS